MLPDTQRLATHFAIPYEASSSIARRQSPGRVRAAPRRLLVGGTRTSLAPGQWAAIYGNNLAGSKRAWGDSDFSGGLAAGDPLPTLLDGVSVSVGNQPAAVYYISPTQIDFQVPAGLPTGNAGVVVNNNGIANVPFNVSIAPASPAFFFYGAGTGMHVSAVHDDGTLVGDPALVPQAVPAHSNEIIEIFAGGLASASAGSVVAPMAFTQPVSLTAGSYNLTVIGSALAAAGEFQINVQLPADIPPGTYPQTLAVPNGSTADSGVSVLLVVAGQ
jgi:uncharacterized protein (TIGR03437 family)